MSYSLLEAFISEDPPPPPPQIQEDHPLLLSEWCGIVVSALGAHFFFRSYLILGTGSSVPNGYYAI